jgi:organic hydroperoxide reductase OsmC/OhrA
LQQRFGMSTGQYQYDVDLFRGPRGGGFLHAEGRPRFPGGAPPEFGGTADVWSPEHLLVSAAALCFLTTFDWLARRAKLEIEAFDCHGIGTVEKTSQGLAFVGIRLDVSVRVAAGQAARTRELLDSAKRTCLVAKTLRCPVEVDAAIEESVTITAVPAP